jgi:hypothetical protein
MRYAFRYAQNDKRHCVLVEGTKAEFRAAERLGCEIIPTNSFFARKWVKDGYQHETALWVDDTGRVRRADG